MNKQNCNLDLPDWMADMPDDGFDNGSLPNWMIVKCQKCWQCEATVMLGSLEPAYCQDCYEKEKATVREQLLNSCFEDLPDTPRTALQAIVAGNIAVDYGYKPQNTDGDYSNGYYAWRDPNGIAVISGKKGFNLGAWAVLRLHILPSRHEVTL